MAKKDFISDNLVHMRELLKKNAEQAGASAPSPGQDAEPAKAPAPKLSGRIAGSRDAGAGKADDSVRRKREFAGKLERDRAAAAAAIEVAAGKLEELRRFEHTLEELDREFRQLGSADTPEGARELEKLSFAHYRASGRASVFLNGRSAGSSSHSRPEEGRGYGNWRQVFPLALALIVSALIVALTMIFLFY